MIYVIGYPGHVGGASTELWHTLRLWRGAGLEVTLINTWGEPPADWRWCADRLGCRTEIVEQPTDKNPRPTLAEQLARIDGLAGATVVSFCNENFLVNADLFRRLGCKVVWVNCMNWLFGHEKRIYAVHGPFDAYVCQSRFQLETLAGQLAKYGVPRGRLHHIPGAFDPGEFRFAPRPHADEFVFGRLSRQAPDKFSTRTWPIADRVNYSPKRYRVLGWDPVIANAIGQPPAWAECLPAGQETAAEFLASLHAMVQINGSAVENWPRVGLEAMAAGVPICTEHRGGWPEMIVDGVTGYTCETDEELAYRISRLAWDEPLRLEIAAAGRERLLELCNPDDLWPRWDRLFQEVSSEQRTENSE